MPGRVAHPYVYMHLDMNRNKATMLALLRLAVLVRGRARRGRRRPPTFLSQLSLTVFLSRLGGLAWVLCNLK